MKFEIFCDWKGTFKEFKYPITVRYEFEGTHEELDNHIKNLQKEGYLNIFFHRI